jgi:hypothetical protein
MSGMSGGLPVTRMPNKGQEMLPGICFHSGKTKKSQCVEDPEALLSFLNVRKIISVLFFFVNLG